MPSTARAVRRGPRALPAHAVAVAAVSALVMALLVEAAPVAGGDLVAQEWWASWASSNRAPVDFGWYGGGSGASSSLLSPDRKSTRLNSSHAKNSYAGFFFKKKKKKKASTLTSQ